MNNELVVTFKWGTSRARNTYGWTTCTCFVNNDKLGKTMGGGYDLKGTAFAHAMINKFHKELLPLADRAYSKYTVRGEGKKKAYELIKNPEGNGLYGLTAYYDENGKPHSVSMDGACGFEAMTHIMETAGFKVKYVKEDVYTLTMPT